MTGVYQALAEALDRRWFNKSTWFEEGYNYQCTGLFKDEQAKFGNRNFAVGGAAKRMPEKTGGRWSDFFDWKLFADIPDYTQLPIGSWIIWGKKLSEDGHIARLVGFVDGGIRCINQWGSDNKKAPDGSWSFAIGKYSNFRWSDKVKGVLVPKYTPEQALEALRKIDPASASQFDQPVEPPELAPVVLEQIAVRPDWNLAQPQALPQAGPLTIGPGAGSVMTDAPQKPPPSMDMSKMEDRTRRWSKALTAIAGPGYFLKGQFGGIEEHAGLSNKASVGIEIVIVIVIVGLLLAISWRAYRDVKDNPRPSKLSLFIYDLFKSKLAEAQKEAKRRLNV